MASNVSSIIHNMANTNFSELTAYWMPSVAFFENISFDTVGVDKTLLMYSNIAAYMTWSTLWKVLLIASIAINFKNFPFVYHLRILNGIRFVLKSQRSSQPLTPEHLFQPLITSSSATLMEMDVFGHKSNSTYFSDVDICRAHLVTTLFSKAIEEIRGSTTMNGLSGKTRSMFTMPLGAVSCCFRRELKPYESYDMWTRILSWDEKWFYLVTHFVKKGARVEPDQYTLYTRQNSVSSSEGANSRKSSCVDTTNDTNTTTTSEVTNPAIAASALSKVVFKNNRRTIRPATMLELAGLLPKEDDEAANEDTHTSPWTRERIEMERQRGMKQAMLLAAQSGLEHELNDEMALGRHYDGHGIEGVVATLAQLGGLSKYQLL